MKRTQFLALILVMLFTASCSNELDPDVEPVAFSELRVEQVLEQETLQLVNTFRVSRSLNALTFNDEVYKVALAHSQKMASEGKMSHDNFVDRAQDLAARLNAVQVAENLSSNFPTAQATFLGWRNSKKHYEAITGDFTHTAVAVVSTPDGDIYYTQIFVKILP